MSTVIAQWHKVLEEGDLKGLDKLIGARCVFHSPIVFKPQEGRRLTIMYLQAAYQMFEGSGFHYVKEVIGDTAAVLEFNATVDGILIDGIDMITWDDNDQIIESCSDPTRPSTSSRSRCWHNSAASMPWTRQRWRSVPCGIS